MGIIYDIPTATWEMKGIKYQIEHELHNQAEGTYRIFLRLDDDDLSFLEAFKEHEDVVVIKFEHLPNCVGKIVEISPTQENPALTMLRLKFSKTQGLQAIPFST